MACQEDAPTSLSGASDNKTAQRADMPSGMLEYLPPVPQMTPTADMAGFGPQPMIDLDEIEAWTFENWSFNPADLQQVFSDPYPPMTT
jgi:hypothetical protein